MRALVAAAWGVLHIFAGPVWPAQHISLADTAVTITIPTKAPAGTESGWVMVMDPPTPGANQPGFTQVGWLWSFGEAPRLFAYTNPQGDGCGCHGTWYLGPVVHGSVTVRIAAVGSMWADQAEVGTDWVTLGRAPQVGGVEWSALAESYGPFDGPVCFSGLGKCAVWLTPAPGGR